MRLFRNTIMIAISLLMFCTVLPYGAVAAIPWENNEIVNHTMKLKYKILKSTNKMEESEELYVFHDNGIVIIFGEGYVEVLRGVGYKWHIDPAGTLILTDKSSKNEISLKKISSKGETIEVLRNKSPAICMITQHPPTIPWSREEIENYRMDLPTNPKSQLPPSSERIEEYVFMDTGTAAVHSGTMAAIAAPAMLWNIDSSGTLIVTDGIGDIVMRKISSRGDTVEVLRSGEPVVYNKTKFFTRWKYNLFIGLIYTVPILIVGAVAFRMWRRIRSSSKPNDTVSNKT